MEKHSSKRTISLILIIGLILAGLVIRFVGLEFESIDMRGFLFGWYDELASRGFAAIGQPFSNYTPPYLYLLWIATTTHLFIPKAIAIKLIAVLFDICNAVLIYRILRIKYPEGLTALSGAALFFILPTVFLNSSFWGQADAIYACFLLASLFCLLQGKPFLAAVFFGISFSFKAQAVFFAPLLLLLAIRKQIPYYYLAVIPIMYVLLMIPALVAGRPFLDLMTIYVKQSSTYHFLGLYAPNLYSFVPNNLYVAGTTLGIIITVVLVCVWLAVCSTRIESFTAETIILSALVVVASVQYLLPKMHDRYFYLADVIAVLAAFYLPRLWFTVLGFQIASGLVYCIFLFIPLQDPMRQPMLITATLVNTATITFLLAEQWHCVKNETRRTLTGISQRIMNTSPQARLILLLLAISAIGILTRVWEFGKLPSGLTPDEASIGTEAYYIYKFGMDRNGMSYPVHLISWGSGQNALYAYLLVPFVVLGGLNAYSIRLPMMLCGIASLPLMYLAGKRLLGEKFALIAMFLLAISPWHIINSRWAVESNILPSIFLAGFTCLILSDQQNRLFHMSCFLFGLCLYAYGTAYVGVPVFLLLTVPALLLAKRISRPQAISGLLLFSVVALPILIFVLINTLRLDTMHLGPFTIPRLPVEARYESMAAIFGENPLVRMRDNVSIMFNVLWTQSDSYPWNHVEPFGYFYKVTFPFAVAGFFLTIPFKFNQQNLTERWLLFSWMIASLVIGVVHPVNLSRINLIFTPILFCIALLLYESSKHLRQILPGAIFVLLAACLLFTLVYHGEDYQKRASGVFNAGIIGAIEYASEKSPARICITEQTYSAYIYVLLTQTPHPATYLNKIEWLYPSDPLDPARTPRTLGRYQFRIADCINDPDAVYILGLREAPPHPSKSYKDKKFMKYIVFIPK